MVVHTVTSRNACSADMNVSRPQRRRVNFCIDDFETHFKQMLNLDATLLKFDIDDYINLRPKAKKQASRVVYVSKQSDSSVLVFRKDLVYLEIRKMFNKDISEIIASKVDKMNTLEAREINVNALSDEEFCSGCVATRNNSKLRKYKDMSLCDDCLNEKMI